ncbi:MAG: DUF523 and DUF1722 domain-containing protein [candidate division KSB1 bacterium]|jgi:uncharacterized protein YbgA (DUF1722 family)/uncharacterized protein YbbK (DUF523 family)|nr:DUF523 and DUF1722 domain-containing protein [candidate division KSB1 bacterium]
MEDRPKLGISTCLLGENVRFDGGHKLDRYLTNMVGQFVDWVPVCPEVECGMSIPREALRLVGTPDNPRLVTSRTGVDKTDQMLRWAKKRLDQLETENLCGYIFKSKSPSSGMRDVKVYDVNKMPSNKGVGIFARAFMDRFPLMPVEDEGRLNDAKLRENFIERIFVFKRWQNFVLNDGSKKGLVDFHSDHKLLFMAHSPKALSELGKLVAQVKAISPVELHERYLSIMMPALKLNATVKKNVNVLQHIMGYFKKVLSAEEKQELLEVIGNYHKGLIPLIVPITLLNHFVRKFKEPYLERQYYLNPHPVELMLRNHV